MLTKMPSGRILDGKLRRLWRWFGDGDRAGETLIRLDREGAGPLPPACGVLVPLMCNDVLLASGIHVNEF